MAMFSSEDKEASKRMREMFGPGHADTSVRQAIHMIWTLLPDDQKTVDALEQHLRRLVDRAIQDLREDAEAFGLGK